MSEDPLRSVLAFARTLGLTEHELRAAADHLADEPRTLGAVLDGLGRHHLADIRRRYPQGLSRVLRGDGPVPGFEEQPLTSFTGLEGRSRSQQLAEHLATTLVQRQRAGGDRHTGHGAVEAYVNALHAVGALLVDGRLLAVNPMARVPRPVRPGATRDPSLTDDELREYLTTILERSPDALLDCALWLLFRITAGREQEILSLQRVDLTVTRGVVLDGKGGRRREMPLPLPVAALLQDLDLCRPGGGRRLVRTDGGASVRVRRLEVWSEALHAERDWARGHDMRVHVLRHTTARAIERQAGLDDVDSALYLGHNLESRIGVTGRYVSVAHPWERRVTIAQSLFGTLDRWPVLPENDVLARVPELADWMPR